MTPMSSQACCSAGGRKAPAVTNSRRPPPSWACTLRNSQAPGSGRAGAGRCRAGARTSAVWPCFSTSRSMALQNRSTTCGTRSIGGDAVLAQAVEDDPRVPAADVEDVGAHVHRVEQRDLLLEAVREGQQRDQPVLHRLDDPVEATCTPASELAWASITPLGLPVVPLSEHELVDVRPAAGGPRTATWASQSGGEGLVRLLGQGRRRWWSGTRSRPTSRGSGASRPVPSRRRTAPDAAMMFAIASALIRESSGT